MSGADVVAWLDGVVAGSESMDRSSGIGPSSATTGARTARAAVAELIEAGNDWCDLMPGLAGGPEFDRLVAALAAAGPQS